MFQNLLKFCFPVCGRLLHENGCLERSDEGTDGFDPDREELLTSGGEVLHRAGGPEVSAWALIKHPPRPSQLMRSIISRSQGAPAAPVGRSDAEGHPDEEELFQPVIGTKYAAQWNICGRTSNVLKCKCMCEQKGWRRIYVVQEAEGGLSSS